MSWSGATNSLTTGDAKITLPFTVLNSTSNTQWEAVLNLYTLASQPLATMVPVASDNGGGIIFARDMGATDQATYSHFGSGSNFRITGSYLTP
jgi:hypothetical protein